MHLRLIIHYFALGPHAPVSPNFLIPDPFHIAYIAWDAFWQTSSGHLCIISTGTTWSFSRPVHTFCHSHEVSFLSTFHDELLNTSTMLGSGHSQVPSQSLGSSEKERNRQMSTDKHCCPTHSEPLRLEGPAIAS